jgi:polysaccharide chain length determinant protein (PEP-CTERM system associated)
MHEVLDQLLSHLRGIWLRRWYALSAAWAIALIGWAVVYSLPQRFEASARVYIDTQSILKPLMSGLAINTPIEQQVQVMTRTLLSRPNMEKVARMSDMNDKAKTPKDMAALVTGLMSNVQLEAANRGQENLYRISYQNSNPEVAKKVVQSLLTILVESSLGNKRKDTDSAKRFIGDQLKTYEQKLIDSENLLKQFKQQHLGVMPTQGGDYFAKLAEAQKNISESTLALREAQTRRDQLKRQLAGEDTGESESATVAGNPEIDARIQNLQKSLDQLRLVYTEQHPDIVGAKRVIAQLEAQKKLEAKNKKPTTSTAASQNSYFQQLSLSLAEAEAQAASMKARVDEYTSRYNALHQQANMVPQIETDLLQLTRDYEVNKKNYDQLLTRRESAQMSEDMDSKTDAIDFKVIDPPYVPPVPAFPNRPFLLSMVLLLAIAGGAGFAFIISQVRPIIIDRSSIADITDYPVLGSVTMVWNVVQTQSRRKKLMVWAASTGALLSAYVVLLGLSLLFARSGA